MNFRKYLLLIYILSFASAETLIDEYSLPRKYWGYMLGYKYDYKASSCYVTWNPRTALLHTVGSGCSEITPEKMRSDAIASIQYILSKGSYSDFKHYYSIQEENSYKNYLENYHIVDAIQDLHIVWLNGCLDNQRKKTPKVSSMISTYIALRPNVVSQIYWDGWNISNARDGKIECRDPAGFNRVKNYAYNFPIMKD